MRAGVLALFLIFLIYGWTCSEKIIANIAGQHLVWEKTTAPMNAQLVKRRTSVIYFRLEQQNFVRSMLGCFSDGNCRIYYLHIGKTGGSGVEDRMFQMYPPRYDGCCYYNTLKRFQEDPKSFCLRKFSTYQVFPSMFLNEILPTCRNITKSKAIVLVTFREPIQRLLSSIHQNCNKNLHLRDNRTLKACNDCSYEKDRDFWDEFVAFNARDEGQLHDVVTATIPNTTVLTVDTSDLSALFKELGEYHDAFASKTIVSSEDTSRCSFGVTSDMIKGLKQSSEVYRNLTIGHIV